MLFLKNKFIELSICFHSPVDTSETAKAEVTELIVYACTSLSYMYELHAKSKYMYIQSTHSLSRSQRDPLNHFEISVLRDIRFAELRKIPIEQPNFTNEHVI